MRNCLIALSGFTTDLKLQTQTLQYAKRGVQLCDTQKHKEDLFRLYDHIGDIYFRQSRYQESFEARLKAVHYAQSFPLAVAQIENNMVEVLRLLGNPDLALEYLERSLHTAIKYQDGKLWSSSLLNISNIKETNSAQSHPYLDSGLRVAHRFGLYETLYSGLLNKSSLWANNGKPKEALQLLEAADTLSRYFFITPVLKAKSDEIAGTAYAVLGQYPKAEQLFLKSLSGTDPMGWLSNMNYLTHLYEIQGDFKKAYYTFRKFQSRVDTLGRNGMRLRVNDLELQYRTSEKDKQLAEQKFNLAKKEKDLQIKNTWIGIMAFGGMMLFVVFLLMRRNLLQRQKIQSAEQANLQLKARIEGEQQERKRISQELHDGIGGILSAAKMNLSRVYTLVPEQAPRYERGVQLLDEAYKELRRTAHNLSPHILKNKGLADTLFSYCRKTAEDQKIDIQFQPFGHLEALNEDIALASYRIIQELIQNIVKHSGASQAMVQLGYQDGQLDITVEDNGKGMASQNLVDGIGLSNIRDRVTALKGHIEIDSQPGEGATIYINIETALINL